MGNKKFDITRISVLVWSWIEQVVTLKNKSIKGYLTTGLVVLLPILASLWVLVTIAKLVKSYLIKPLTSIYFIQQLSLIIPGDFLDNVIVGIIAIILLIALLVGLGMLTRNVFGRWFLSGVDSFFARVPVANTVYNFVKNLIENFNIVGVSKFEEVVAVEFPGTNLLSIGFVTRKVEGKIKQTISQDRLAIFVPTGPNPTTGFIVMAVPSDVIRLDITPEEALKFIVSGGVLMPGVSDNPTGNSTYDRAT